LGAIRAFKTEKTEKTQENSLSTAPQPLGARSGRSSPLGTAGALEMAARARIGAAVALEMAARRMAIYVRH